MFFSLLFARNGHQKRKGGLAQFFSANLAELANFQGAIAYFVV
jgi:hypothetical protein